MNISMFSLKSEDVNDCNIVYVCVCLSVCVMVLVTVFARLFVCVCVIVQYYAVRVLCW